MAEGDLNNMPPINEKLPSNGRTKPRSRSVDDTDIPFWLADRLRKPQASQRERDAEDKYYERRNRSLSNAKGGSPRRESPRRDISPRRLSPRRGPVEPSPSPHRRNHTMPSSLQG